MAIFTNSERAKAFAFLDSMELDRAYLVPSGKLDLIKEWIADKPYDGEISFNSDWTKFYKCALPPDKDLRKK